MVVVGHHAVELACRQRQIGTERDIVSLGDGVDQRATVGQCLLVEINGKIHTGIQFSQSARCAERGIPVSVHGGERETVGLVGGMQQGFEGRGQHA